MEVVQQKQTVSSKMFICHKKEDIGSEPTYENVKTYQLIDVVAREFNVTQEEMLSRSRKQEYVDARFYYMFLLHKVFKISQKGVERILGWDHATVIHACKAICNYIEYDREFRMKDQRVFEILRTSIIKTPSDPKVSKKQTYHYFLRGNDKN